MIIINLILIVGPRAPSKPSASLLAQAVGPASTSHRKPHDARARTGPDGARVRPPGNVVHERSHTGFPSINESAGPGGPQANRRALLRGGSLLELADLPGQPSEPAFGSLNSALGSDREPIEQAVELLLGSPRRALSPLLEPPDEGKLT